MNEEQARRNLSTLIEQAEKDRKWLFCHYQELWFSPQELRALNAKGRFLWGPANWQLRDPEEHVKVLAERIEEAKAAHWRFKMRVSAWYAGKVLEE